MKNVKWMIAVVTLLLLSVDAALACRCPKAEASADLSQFAAVFSGRVVETNRLPTSLRVKFQVERVWKGDVLLEVTLFLPRASDPDVISSCDIGFQKGESYLVYALKSRDRSTLTTHKCTRTRKVTEAKGDFAVLDEGQVPTIVKP